MQITIDTSLGTISDLDRRVLGVLLGEGAAPAPVAAAPEPAPALQPVAAPTATVEVPEDLEPVTETPEDDEVTPADLVRVATELVSTKGLSAEVRAVLQSLGFSKVSLVKEPADRARLMQELKKLG